MPKITLATEPLPLLLSATKVLMKVHVVALNYRDANPAEPSPRQRSTAYWSIQVHT